MNTENHDTRTATPVAPATAAPSEGPEYKTKELLTKLKDHGGISIDLHMPLATLIDDRVYKKMQAFADFKRGAWIAESAGNRLLFAPAAALAGLVGSLPKPIQDALANYDVDKEAVLLAVDPIEIEVRDRDSRKTIRTRGILVTKPNTAISLKPIEEAV